MRILLVGEYSNVHATLAEGLRMLGHEVTVMSNGDFWKDYPRDINVARIPGKAGGIRLMLRLLALLPSMRGYDVVQLINPMFFELKAERLGFFYRWLRRHNRHVVLGGFGMDWYWVNTCVTDKPLRYSDFNIGSELRTDEEAMKERRDWLHTAKERLNKMIAADCDAIVTGLYEYHVCYAPCFPQKTHFIPFPVRQATTAPVRQAATTSSQALRPSETVPPQTPSGKLRIFIGISKGRSAYKGTDIMLRAAQAIAGRYADRVELRMAEGLPFAVYQQLLDSSDVLLDQLYSYTPAMNALLAMSKGLVVVGGGEEEQYELMGEPELRPIVNVLPDYEHVCEALEQLVLHPERVPELKWQGMEYIRRHHDYLKVARQYEDLYAALP